MKNKSLEKQMALLPSEVKWCKRCVISNQRPRIQFSEDGVCTACLNREFRQNIDWDARDDQLSNSCSNIEEVMVIGMWLCRVVEARTRASSRIS